jgi:glutamine amidotransferase
MCRVLAYLGSPIPLENLLYKPDSSLLKQAYRPQMLQMLNLAGFGMLAWDPASHLPEVPYRYATTELPVFDANLRSLSAKLRPRCALAHVRGVPYHEQVHVSRQNLHPFHYDGTPLALAHNGDLAQFDLYKFCLAEHVRPEIRVKVRGSTDSEWIYALLLSQLEDPGGRPTIDELVRAVDRALAVVRTVREQVGAARSSSTNLFVTEGSMLIATRFTYDFGCYGDTVHEGNLQYLSLWFTVGRDYDLYDGEWKMIGGAASSDSILIASEPLTVDTSTWLEVPEYSALCAKLVDDKLSLRTVELTA